MEMLAAESGELVVWSALPKVATCRKAPRDSQASSKSKSLVLKTNLSKVLCQVGLPAMTLILSLHSHPNLSIKNCPIHSEE